MFKFARRFQRREGALRVLNGRVTLVIPMVAEIDQEQLFGTKGRFLVLVLGQVEIAQFTPCLLISLCGRAGANER